MDHLASASMVGALGAYVASTLSPLRGLHDWLVPGAIRKNSAGLTLTFDDGPHPERTPAVLDILAKAGLKATFFVIGERAARHPDLVRRIAQEGHALGNHGWSHRWMPGLASREIDREIDRCQEIVAELVGELPRLIRPPYGHRDLRFNLASRRRGLTVVLWSVDSFDYFGCAPATVLWRVRRVVQGEIVLFHDGNPRARGLLPALERWAEELSLAGTPVRPIALPVIPGLPVEGV